MGCKITQNNEWKYVAPTVIMKNDYKYILMDTIKIVSVLARTYILYIITL